MEKFLSPSIHSTLISGYLRMFSIFLLIISNWQLNGSVQVQGDHKVMERGFTQQKVEHLHVDPNNLLLKSRHESTLHQYDFTNILWVKRICKAIYKVKMRNSKKKYWGGEGNHKENFTKMWWWLWLHDQSPFQLCNETYVRKQWSFDYVVFNLIF